MLAASAYQYRHSLSSLMMSGMIIALPRKRLMHRRSLGDDDYR